MENRINNIPSRIRNASKDYPYVAGAVDIIDDNLNKNQEHLNEYFDEVTHDVYRKEEVNNMISRCPETPVVTVDVPEGTDIATYLSANIPAGERANRLFRVPGPSNSSFSEWAWTGTQFIMLDEKDYGVDGKIKEGSQNLATSGAVYKHVSENCPIVDSRVDTDLDIVDGKNKMLARFSGGHIKTKDFDSAKSVMQDDGHRSYDLAISDENGNDVVQFLEGHIKTKEFDSRDIKVKTDYSRADFAVSDENGNDIMQLEGGHIRTRNFDSKKVKDISLGYSENDFSISDNNNNDIVQFSGGNIRTKNFDSRQVKDIKVGYYENDFSISDGNENEIVRFSKGDIRTKNFDSRDVKNLKVRDTDCDFAISDNDGNDILKLQNGHIRTKNFDSSKLSEIDIFTSKYRGKKISILGDSISTYGVPDSRNQEGTYCYSYYPKQTCRYSQVGNVTEGGVTYDSIPFNVNDTWWMRVIHSLGGELGINESWRGSAISNVRDQALGENSSFCYQGRINHLGGNGNPDLILVFGGTNDAGNGAPIGTFDTTPPPTTAGDIAALGNSTFAEAYRTMLIRLMFAYPNAEIVVLLPTFTTAYYTIAALDNYVEIIKEACDFFGIKYIDVRTSGITYYNKSTYLVDGIHPNSLGMKMLADKVIKQLLFI